MTNNVKLITIYKHVILRPEFTSPDAGTAKTHHHIHVFQTLQALPHQSAAGKRFTISKIKMIQSKILGGTLK